MASVSVLDAGDNWSFVSHLNLVVEEQGFTEAQAVALGVVEEILELSMIDWHVAVSGDAQQMLRRFDRGAEGNVIAAAGVPCVEASKLKLLRHPGTAGVPVRAC